MNYLTQYYMNLCEELQAKINMLEANIRSASEIEQIGQEEYKKALEKKKAEKGELSMQDIEVAAGETIAPYVQRSLRRERLITKATEQLPDVAHSGDVETAKQYADVMGEISKRNISGKVVGYGNLPPESAESIKAGQEQISKLSKEMRGRGVQTLVPADIASMRKFIQMGKGKYEAPYPQPTEMTPDVHDGIDPDTTGSSSEVVSSQRKNQYRGNLG